MKNWIRSQVRACHGVLLRQWAQADRTHTLPVTNARTLVFAPHPDDETFGCGGLIAAKRQQNVSVGVVFLTDGRNCYGAGGGPPKGEVAALRRNEALNALHLLGVAPEQIFFLDIEDGTLGKLTNAEREKAVADLSALLRDFAPKEMFVPHRTDRHKDHEAAFALLQEARAGVAVHQVEYVIWRFWEAPLFCGAEWKAVRGAHYVPLDKAAFLAKQRAIAAYVSQTALLPRAFVWQHRASLELFYPEVSGGTE